MVEVNESTLEHQLHAQMKDDLGLDKLYTIYSTGKVESEMGWDAGVPELKWTVFQYKSAEDRKDGLGFDITDTKKEGEKATQLEAMKSYDEHFHRNFAYYGLPLITRYKNLDKTLERTIFINATDMPSDTSTLQEVPEDYCESHVTQYEEPIKVHRSKRQRYNTGDREDGNISPSNILGWKELKEKILACEIGQKEYEDGERILQTNDNIDEKERGAKFLIGFGDSDL